MTRTWVNRFAPELLVVALLAATGAAFVHTERQKLKPSPLTIVRVDESVAPLCRCPQSSATISLELRARSDVALAIVDDAGDVVRMLIADRRPSGGSVVAHWNGRDDGGRVVADGAYRPRIHVTRERRTFLLAQRIRVDTVPPVITGVRVAPRELVRRGPRSHVNIRYRLSERAQPLLYVDGRRAVVGWWRSRAGKLEWYGRLGGEQLPPARYRLRLAARDEAGNLGRAVDVLVVRIRGARGG